MSLLNVTVKKALFVGAQAAQFNTYVTLKLQHVKSTTVTVKGPNPCWEQDFLFETNDLNSGLLIEVWSKGMIWDRAMGYHLIPLETVQYANEGPHNSGGPDTSNSMHYTEDESYDGNGQWLSLEAELVMRDGEVVGTKNPTGHSLLVDCRFELPFGRYDPPTGWQSILRETCLSSSPVYAHYDGPGDVCFGHIDPENTEGADLQRKLEMLNNIMDQEARAEQARRQMQYFGHSGYSEDSDYTSDLNYPVGQHANSSASQFRSAAGQMHTPNRSLETSRENSYERDDLPNNHHQHHLPAAPMTNQHRLSPGNVYHGAGVGGHHRLHNSASPNHHQRISPNAEDFGYNTSENAQNSTHLYNDVADSEPLFYNSRPRNNYKQRYSSQDTWYSAEYGQSMDSVGLDTTSTIGRSSSGYPADGGYFGNSTGASTTTASRRTRATPGRRPSLERQTTLYDDQYYNADNNGYYPSIEVTDTRQKPFNKTYDEFFDASSSFPYQEERYGQDEEDRQWDSGGLLYQPNKTTINNATTTVYQENHVNKRRKSTLPPTPSVHKSTSYYTPKKPYEDESYPTAPTPSTGRRRIPQVPTRRATSRQGSLNNDDYETTCRTPENSAHRGASLPPTPTATPKLLARLANVVTAGGKPSVSLPPTPGRQLPKPNLNHRSAKARRNNLMKRTSSADYADIETEDAYNSYYIRPGAMSATQMYNEDYNYAYQSIDNLPAQPDDEQLEDQTYNTTKPYEIPPYNNISQTYDDIVTTTATTTLQQPYDLITNSFVTTTSAEQPSYNTYNTTTTSYSTSYDTTFYDTKPYEATNAETYKPYESTNTESYDMSYTNQFDGISTTSYDNTINDTTNSYEYSYNQPTSQPSVVVSSERRTSLTQQALETMNAQQDSNLLGYQAPPNDEYYYSATDDRDYQDEYEYEQQQAQAAAARKKRLGGRRENSPLMQQNTDSLESRDDELKDSFETAVSSISSSQQYQRRTGGYSDYTTAGDTLSTSTTSAMPLPVDSPQKSYSSSATTTVVTATQYNRDQTEQPSLPKAIVSVNGTSVRDNVDNTNANHTNTQTNASSVINSLGGFLFGGLSAAASAVSAVTNNAKNLATSNINAANNNTANKTSNNRGFLKQQESIDRSGYLQQQESIDHSGYLQQQDSIDRSYNTFQHQESLDQSEYQTDYYDDQDGQDPMMNDNYIKTDATDHHYFNQQESIESYTEEQELPNGMLDEYNGKQGKESPVSVIHVESYDPDAAEKDDELSELQSQQNLMDPYHPNHQRLAAQLDPYAPPASVRRASIDPYRPVSPTRRTSGDSYQGSRKSSIVDNYSNSVARKSSLDPYQPEVSRRASVRHSPVQEMHKQDSVDQGMSPQGSIIGDGVDEPEKKNVSFEEEQEMQQPRREVTAKQRWHWAYNKIIMQLNVSNSI